MLSLCLIARDEEALLPDCLASVQGIVDEIVVADTGSTDRTVAIAEAAGAKVVHHTWADDFAAARNAALAGASGDWILVLDADERLVDGSKLLKAVANARFDLGMLRLHNAASLEASEQEILSGTSRRGEAIWLPRLFRRTPDLRWEGVVHEIPRTWLEKGRQVSQVEVDIVHLGNVPALRDEKNKRERNLRLLQRRCELEPGCSTAWAYLAAERIHAGNTKGAREAIEAGWTALKAQLAGPGLKPTFINLVSVRAHLQLRDGEAEGALDTLRQACAWGADHPNLPYLRGHALEQLGRLEEAMEAYEQARNHSEPKSEEIIPGANSWGALIRQAELSLALDRPSRRTWEQVLKLGRDTLQVRLGLAESLTREGHHSECIAALEGLLTEGTPDAWCLAALACSQLGRPQDMVQFTRSAASAAEKIPFISPRRRTLLAELLDEAALYEGRANPGPTMAGRLSALIQREPLCVDPVPGDRAAVIATNLVRIGRPQLLESMLEPRAEDLLTGFREALDAALTSMGATLEDDGEPDFVFIGGAGRSGTTLFRSMLSAHPRFWCGPELKLVSAICGLRDQWLDSMGSDLREAGVTAEVLDDAVRSFISSLLRGTAQGERIAEKTPHNLLHMKSLGRMFPQARFIHVVRDGRAVSASLVKQAWMDPATGGPVWYCSDLESASRYWAQVVSVVRQQSRAVPGRFLELRYEDLVTNPDLTMRRVLAFLGERWDPAVLEHHKANVRHSKRESSTAAARKRVNTAALERWRTELDEDALRKLDPTALRLLEELGYAA